MHVIEVMSANMLTSVLLTVFFLSGALPCPWSNLFVTTPQRMEALNGSCLHIPCSFSARYRERFDGGETFGVWLRSYPKISHVIFNSSETVNRYPIKLMGNLRRKDCTTLFLHVHMNYSDKYFFRVESWPFRETAFCDHLQLTVRDSPPSPKIQISGDLTEKSSVTVTCSAFTPCPHSPPKLTWNLLKDSQSNMVKNADGTFTTQIQESITLTDSHNGFNITCSATYPVNEGTGFKSAEETRTLRVSYAPKDTSASISPSDVRTAGATVNLTCSSRAKPSVRNFTWFKFSPDGPLVVSEGEFYIFNITEGGVYYCVARNDLGNPEFGVIVHVTVKILGIVTLCTAVIIFECWFRSRCRNKPVKVHSRIRDSQQ
ncbi:vascular cell adhesion protein 1-like isoform X4 [Xyrichtys novacula]|uniref:Vascular cell adhesion protein 1-like isoform X4 n=1 Tax=Xyrichtys novacula TaxID=13765 RepID=A0AAV1H8X1_XYRNO|nr:vascular cell adhesion protein 1-like isoform X4 [Xyrichtys novacula]